MRLKRLKLENFCQHRKVDWTLPSGVIGFLGSNGSGKSNALKAAYTSLTNDYTRNPGTRAEHISDFASPDEPSYIEAVWEHAGVEFKILRSLRPLRSELLIDNRKITAATDIQHEIENVLGISRQIIDNYVFVPQWQMFGFLEAKPADRAKLFAHLCGTGLAELVHSAVGDQIKLDLPLTAKDDVDADALRVSAAEAADQIALFSEEQDRLVKEQSLLPEMSALQLTIDNYAKAVMLKSALLHAQEDLDKASAELTSISDALLVVEGDVDEAEKLEQEARPEAEVARDAIKQFQQSEKLRKRRDELVARQKWLVEHPVVYPIEPSNYLKDHAQAAERLQGLRGTLATAKKIVTTFEDSGLAECPTCGTAVDTMEEHLQDCRDIVDRLPDEIDDLHQAMKVTTIYLADVQKCHEKSRARERELESLQAELLSLEDVGIVSGNLGELQQIVDDHAKLLLDHNTMLSVHRKLATSLQVASDRVARATAAVKTAKAKAAGVKVDEKAHKLAQEQRKARTQLTVDIAQSSGHLALAKERAQNIQQAIAKHKKSVQRAARADKWIEHLEEVRTVFHRDQLPKVVADSCLRQLAVATNANLQDFCAPFTVAADDELSFTFRKKGQPPRNANWLSGGEMVVLAVAFRTAVNSLFAKDIGMMVLDEPTAGLDVDNLKYLEKALQRLGETSRNSNRQIIMVTHEPLLERTFDHVVTL